MTKRYCDRAMSWCAWCKTVHANSEFSPIRVKWRTRQAYCQRGMREYNAMVRRERAQLRGAA